MEMLEKHLGAFTEAELADRDTDKKRKGVNPGLMKIYFDREIEDWRDSRRGLAETPTSTGASFDLVFYPVLLLGAFALFFLPRCCLKRREREASIPRWRKADHAVPTQRDSDADLEAQ